MSYTKLFHRIITSSIWDEPNPTRIVWVTMLALANQDGYVGSTLKSLAMLSRVTEKECQVALDTFLNPDRESRSPENDGRRIERVEGGWVLLNYEKHRNAVSDDPSAIANRERQKRYRALRNVMKRDLASASASVSASSVDRGGGEGEFKEAWTLYPDKAGRHAASVAYAKWRKAGDTQEEIKAGIERYIASVTRRRANGFPDLKFQNGSTFFNQRGWKSEWEEASNTPSATPVRYARRSDCQLMPATFTPPEGKEHEYAKVS